MENPLNGLRARATALWDKVRPSRDGEVGGSAPPHRKLRIAALLILFLLLYYPVGMLLYHKVDDDMDIQPAPQYVVPGGSKAIATVVTLVARETDRWAPNKPFWHPAAALDNMPNFQMGVIYAVSRFVMEMGDYLGRVRGTSSIDVNLDQAVGLLKYDGRAWYWGNGNIIPMAKAETQYRKGVEALIRYNRDVGAGKSVYERRADNLIAVLDRVAADLGSASATLDARTRLGTGYWDTTSDDVFFDVKGKMYGYYMILRDLGEDFAPVIEQRNAGHIWRNMLDSLRDGAKMDPLVVANGEQDSMTVPSHLATLGFQLSRARMQIREIEDTLQK